MERNLGDILEASDRRRSAGRHYIIFYDGFSDDEFLAGVLTSTDRYEQNIIMNSNHFKEIDENGNRYKVTYKNSKLVPAKLFKPEEWGPYKKVGELTEEGYLFVKNHIDILKAEYWKNYVGE